ncbi:hypothetical protein BDW62DRAFT_188772 [Aspergillus aurantiobrunneus]
MYTSTLIYLALALTSNAIPLSQLSSSTTLQPSTTPAVQRRSAEYDVVNVGGVLNAPPAVETVVQTITTPGVPPQTVTVTVATTSASPTSTSLPSSSAAWSTIAFGSSTSVFPVTTPVPEEPAASRGFTAMDRLSRALGKSIDSHLRVRDGNVTRDIKTRSNESTPYSQLNARNANGTDTIHLPRGQH